MAWCAVRTQSALVRPRCARQRPATLRATGAPDVERWRTTDERRAAGGESQSVLQIGRATRVSFDIAVRRNNANHAISSRRTPNEMRAQRNVACSVVRVHKGTHRAASRAATPWAVTGDGRERRWATTDGRTKKGCQRRLASTAPDMGARHEHLGHRGTAHKRRPQSQTPWPK